MAKIPIILESGRADGKLIKTNSVYDDNQEKFLSDKIKEIDDNHNTLNNTVKSLTNTINNNKSDIETKLETEKTRAINVENTLKENITTLTNTVNTNNSNINTKLQEEITRAKNSETTIDAKVDMLSEQRISYVSPCFANCADTHEDKLQSITLAPTNIAVKRIFSITIKLADNLTLLNYSPAYMHLKDSAGNYIGVSQNAIKQMYNRGKYVTWFFDGVINNTNNPIIIKLHTTNSMSNANDSNSISIIAHVKKERGTIGSGATTIDGVYHEGWITAIGLNIVNISAIYPQIKELQKYRMSYATSELPDISTTGHKANINEIRINQNIMGISLVNSISLMVANDNASSEELYLKIYDINDNLIATSNNTVRLSQNLGKYVTWYFTPFQLIDDAIYKFSAWNKSNVNRVMRIHVANGKSEGVTCFDQYNSQHTDYCPALGININAITTNDLYKTIKEVNIALGNSIVVLDPRIAALEARIAALEAK